MTTTDRFHRILIEHLGVAREAITPEARFEDLGCDSLDMIELTMATEEEFGFQIADDEAAAMETVGAALTLIESKTA